MLRISSLFFLLVGTSGSRMQTRHLPPWLLSGPDGGKCPSVVSASILRATSPAASAREIYQSCWLHRPRDALSDTGSGCAQLAKLWHLAVHYHPATSAESFCSSLRELIPDPVPQKNDVSQRTLQHTNVSVQNKPLVQQSKANASVSKTPAAKQERTLQEKLEESRKKLHEPYVPVQQQSANLSVQKTSSQTNSPMQQASTKIPEQKTSEQDKSPVQQESTERPVQKTSTKDKPPVQQGYAKLPMQKTSTHAQSSLHLQSNVSSAQELRNNCVASVRRTLRGLAGDSPLADIAGGNLGEAAKAECQRLHPQSPPKTCSRFSAALVAAAEQGPPVDARVLCDRLLGDLHSTHAMKAPATTSGKSGTTLKTHPTSTGASGIAPITAVVLPAKLSPQSPAKVPSDVPPMRQIPAEDIEERNVPAVSTTRTVLSTTVASTTAAATTVVAALDASRILGAAAAPLRALSKASSQLISEFKHLITGNHTASLLTSKVALAKVAMQDKDASRAKQNEAAHETAAKTTAATTTTTTTSTTTTTTVLTSITSGTTISATAKTTSATTAAAAAATAATSTIMTSSTHALGNSSADVGAATFLSGFVDRYESPGTVQKSTVVSRDAAASSDPTATFLSSFVSRYQEDATSNTKSLKRHARVAKALSPEDSFVQSFLQRW